MRAFENRLGITPPPPPPPHPPPHTHTPTRNPNRGKGAFSDSQFPNWAPCRAKYIRQVDFLFSLYRQAGTAQRVPGFPIHHLPRPQIWSVKIENSRFYGRLATPDNGKPPVYPRFSHRLKSEGGKCKILDSRRVYRILHNDAEWLRGWATRQVYDFPKIVPFWPLF